MGHFRLFYLAVSLNKIQDESQVAKEENAQAKEKTQEDACKVQVDPHPTIFNFEDILLNNSQVSTSRGTGRYNCGTLKALEHFSRSWRNIYCLQVVFYQLLLAPENR